MNKIRIHELTNKLKIKRKALPFSINRILTDNYRSNDGIRKSSMDPKTKTLKFDEEQDIYLFSMYLLQISY